MRRYVSDNRPSLRPVERIELSEKHVTLRFVLFTILLLIASVSLVFALSKLLADNGGWREIEANSSDKISCASEFIFNYKFDSETSRVEYKHLTELYTKTAEEAYAIFTNDVDYDDIINVKYINAHPNEEITVSPVLYNAFWFVKEYSNRNIYLAPIYEMYDNCFFCNDDSELVNYDPYSSDEVREFYLAVSSYAKSPEMVDIKLLDENKIKLFVADEYMKFAKQNVVGSYIDFNWMKNAFIIDHIAETVKSEGFTNGVISSCDGFVRTLGESDDIYNFELYDRVGDTVHHAAELNYTKPLSIVSMRDFRMSNKELRYYEKQNSDMLTPYVDTADGVCRQSRSSILFYSENRGCADILLSAIPVYVTKSFDTEKLDKLNANGIRSIYCEDSKIIHNGSEMSCKELYGSYTVE